ncbi:SDR family NAD(P)-dependent oxidoreductase [Arthrobacter sp. H5]|uniref:SDR family NAD(P)-dependent oxidoreductase n=1 Tax=Arthrobacter sp. H5 TaxID=1267973 RepID=UPI00047FA9FB|nr:SDR family NAD(P)-dependent oxidoreductase [Arthrobacter sp. H5]
MAETALITGATAGLGAEFAAQLAAQGVHLVLVARNSSRLEQAGAELALRHKIEVESIAVDLLDDDDDGVAAVVLRLTDRSRPVGTLINNAGYGLAKPFADNSFREELDHLTIHLIVPLALSHAALQGMRSGGHGRIINVASVAGFAPRGTYGAVKAAMISFSRWANITYRRDGITVTAVCPGFVHTEFHHRMGVDKRLIPGWMWLDAHHVVRAALRDSAQGKAVSIPSLKYKVLTALARIGPSSLVASAARRGR